ncbi:MAG: hypothetical protein EXR73_10745 [Myxococcales bacterium]|nr:hypothetical protein [Myxococcales bacterium]
MERTGRDHDHREGLPQPRGPCTVIVSPNALVEVVQIVAWWSENRPRAPRLFQTELDDALLLIAESPQVGVRAPSKRVGNASVVELRHTRYRLSYQLPPFSRSLARCSSCMCATQADAHCPHGVADARRASRRASPATARCRRGAGENELSPRAAATH